MKSSAKRSPRARRSRRRPRRRLLVSCEHGGNGVPAEYRALFAGAGDVLTTHRALDIGAATVARAFGRRLGVAPFTASVTRLVVDLNRSPGNRNVFSQYTRSLPAERRAAAMARRISSADASATWPIVSSVAGLTFGKVAPESASTSFPSISILASELILDVSTTPAPSIRRM